MKKNYLFIIAVMFILTMFSQNNYEIIRKSTIQSSEYFERFNINFNNEENVILSEEITLETSKKIKISGYCDIVNENTVDIYYRIFTKNWNGWVRLKISPHQESQIKNRIFYQGRNEVGNIKKIQFKINNSKNNGDCTFKVFFPLKLNTKTTYRQSISNRNKSNCPQPNYLSRDSWCLDNDCQNNNPIPTTPTHIAIHHSAGLDISPPYSAEVFSIWDDHVNDREWDDIGYNWIIAPDGQIFEGRGSGIKGSNFSCMNTGITGICLLGNFEWWNFSAPTGEAINSLVDLIKWEATDKNIIVNNNSLHESSGLYLDHIIGHNDSNSSPNSCNNTQCPGDNLKTLIPSIKDIVNATSCYQDFLNNCITANAGPNITIQNGGSTTLQGSGGSSCSWSPTTGLSNPNSCTTTASPTQTTTYTLTVTENGCTDTDIVTVTVQGSTDVTPPANDDCDNAINLTSSTSCNFTTGTVKDATPSYGANNCLGCSCTSPDDFDVYYKFTAVATTHTVTLSNYASNFDAVIELRTACSSGTSNYISCYDPAGAPTSVSETWDNLTIGQTYYIRVFEWGYQQSSPSSDTFDICVTHQNNNTNGVDLISNISSVSNSNPNAGNQITINYTVTNIGDFTMTANTSTALYLSTNQSYDSSDILLSGSVYALTSNLSHNESKNISSTVTLPNVSDGQYYIISYADSIDVISENNENNNTNAFAIQIGDTTQNGPDLDVVRVRVVPDSGLVPGQEVEIEIRIENEGNEDSDSFEVLVFLDIDGDNKYDSNEYMGEFTFNALDADEKDTRFVDFDLPTNIQTTGGYELFVVADSNNDINETNENNNDKGDNITIELANDGVEDVTLLNESINITNVNAGGTVDVVVNHVYLGNQTTSDLPTLNLGYYLSTDCNFNIAEDIYLDQDTSNLGVNNPNIAEDETLTIPISMPSGIYYILFVADSHNEVEEGALENNNVECIQITINGNNTPNGDIYITDEIANPTDVVTGSEIEVFANMNYTGNLTRDQIPSIEIFYFLSNDCELSNDDINIYDTSFDIGSDLPINDVSKSIELPENLSSGTYYIIMRVDMENAVYENNENNNTACVQFNLLTANATYQDVTFNNPYLAVTEANFGDQVYASVHQNYTGYQSDSDLGSIRMEYYLSTDCTLSSDDFYFTYDTSSLGYDDPSQFEYANLLLPTNIAAGNYYILFVADTEDIIAENNENNNTECLSITINDGSLSISENGIFNKVNIFPNPVNSMITISLGQSFNKTNIEFFNLIGQRVHSYAIKNKEVYKVNMYPLPNGVYIIRIIIDGKYSKEFKIIKL